MFKRKRKHNYKEVSFFFYTIISYLEKYLHSYFKVFLKLYESVFQLRTHRSSLMMYETGRGKTKKD